MARPKTRRPVRNGIRDQKRLANLVDDIADYEEFCAEILPALRKDIAAGKTAQQIYEKYQAIAAARSVAIAMRETDSGKALAAIRDILDRSSGKPTEKKEVTHKLEKLEEKELDALLLTELADLSPRAKH